MLMACHALITKYLSQHFLQRANPEGKVSIINHCLLIRPFEICQVVWVRKNVVQKILRDWVGATVMLPTNS
jgi:hypothetical protein